MSPLIALALSILLIALVFVLRRAEARCKALEAQTQVMQTQLQHTERRLAEREEHLRAQDLEYKAMQEALHRQELDYRLLQQERQQLEQALAASQGEKERLVETLEERFKVLTTRLLDERSQQLLKRNEESLNPLREDLKRFGEQVQLAYNNEARERASLQTEIRLLVEQSNRISADANNLTQALKGNNKVQGNWGEMILEDLLTSSGLERGRHFIVQERFLDQETGRAFAPDVIINYPNGGRMVIDSKVNLKHYMEYVAAQDEVERQRYAKLHVEALRGQIRELHSKHYGYKVQGAPDFVMMFVPNEPAYLLAMRQEPLLWHEGYEKKVLIMNATNLMAALKLAEELWRREQQQLNVEAIFTEVGRLYDQFHNYLSYMEKTSDSLDKARNHLDEAYKRLSTGQGNVIRRFEQLRKMGAKTKKQLRSIAALASVVEDDESDPLEAEVHHTEGQGH